MVAKYDNNGNISYFYLTNVERNSDDCKKRQAECDSANRELVIEELIKEFRESTKNLERI